MSENIKISWSNESNGKGEAVIYMNKFFPANVGILKKIIKKIINLDHEHREEIINEMINYCENSIPELEEKMNQMEKNYFDNKEVIADLVSRIKEQENLLIQLKRQNDKKEIYKEENNKLKELKSKYKKVNSAVKGAIKKKNLCLKQIELYKKDIKILEKGK